METINIAAGGGTPEIVLDFSNSRFSFTGESYPEDVNAFYGDIIDKMTSFIKSLKDGTVIIHMHLIYFNSASTKVFHNLFQMIENAVDLNSISAQVDWLYHEEDDMSLEFVNGFGEDFERIKFNLITVE